MKHGFLRRVPSLKNTPARDMVYPPRKLEEAKRVETLKGRLEYNEKLTKLNELCENVVRSRTGAFSVESEQTSGVREKYQTKRLAQ